MHNIPFINQNKVSEFENLLAPELKIKWLVLLLDEM